MNSDGDDSNSPPLRYAFAAIFVTACLYDLELGVRVAGIFMAGVSLYDALRGKVSMIDIFWKTDHFLTGVPAIVLSAIVSLISTVFIFEPGWVLAMLAITVT